MSRILELLQKHKYVVLLAGLLQHLFIGIFLTDMDFYAGVIWPLNMVFLGVASVGVYSGKGKWQNRVRLLLFIIVLCLPLTVPFFKSTEGFMEVLSLVYTAFFVLILWEVMVFLIKPGYINSDIISASACGYLLLIEISAFVMQFVFYMNPESISPVSNSGPALTFIDLVYYSTILQTTIGLGDITPVTHHAKLLSSLFGISGQFYTVVLVGILISKFSSRSLSGD